MLFLVATNVVASRPPERRPTGTPHARANIRISFHTDTDIRIFVLKLQGGPSWVGNIVVKITQTNIWSCFLRFLYFLIFLCTELLFLFVFVIFCQYQFQFQSSTSWIEFALNLLITTPTHPHTGKKWFQFSRGHRMLKLFSLVPT